MPKKTSWIKFPALILAISLLTSCKSPVGQAAEEPFTGLPEDQIVQGFSPQVNQKAFDYRFFCYDDEGNIYFSNPKDNFHLYSYDGSGDNVGRCKQLTDFPAFGLDYYDGSVYFLTDDRRINLGDMGENYGLPYKYDPGTGEVQKIGDEIIHSMTVIDGEIYGLNIENDCFVYKYGEGEKLFNSFDIKKTGDYFLTFESSGDTIRSYLQSPNDRRLFISDDIPINGFFAFGKYYYKGQESHELRSVDLSDGETYVYGKGMHDYTLLGGELYILGTDQFLYLYKDSNLTKLDDAHQYDTIYSNNKNLYAIGKEYNLASSKMEYFFVKLDENFVPEVLG
ncbi:MAG: DUF5050 domain-containing protein [Oscillospiraceae bacterium]|nr:DUF5050 domain-containing protein [Oscillospiraceae bacterium]